MSGMKRLKKAIEHIRVVAMPTKVRDNDDGTKTQLYRVTPLN